ncbi:MAG TPA: hypothetical protein VHK69_06555 [Chitinophagaceae bacterium]|jgi:hypothetical protein|nr:hypothetical protein [Chitinophagaceae bacterium]
MYNAIWKKYIAVIRILLKRAANEQQTLQLNVSDFEKVGPQKKTGFNFTLKFIQGRVDDLAGLSNTAKELAAVLVQDPQISELFRRGEFHLGVNSKFLLTIRMVQEAPEVAEPALAAENAE